MMRATKKRCLMVSWMLAYVERVDDSAFSAAAAHKLLQSLTPLQKIERLPAYLRMLREQGDRESFTRFVGQWLSLHEPVEGAVNSFVEGHLFWSQRMWQLQRQLEKHGEAKDALYYINVGLVGWDMARLQLLSRVAYDRGLISNREMWDNVICAWKQAASVLDSWQELGFSCLLGYVLHADSIPVEQLYACYQKATESPDSPWSATRFK